MRGWVCVREMENQAETEREQTLKIQWNFQEQNKWTCMGDMSFMWVSTRVSHGSILLLESDSPVLKSQLWWTQLRVVVEDLAN